MSYANEFFTTGLWASTDLDGNYLDGRYTLEDIPESLRKEADGFIALFLRESVSLLTEQERANSPIAHDLWLTCEGHGAGFWDGDYENGDALTELASRLVRYGSYWSDKLRDSLPPTADQD